MDDLSDDEEPLDSGPIDFESLQVQATETAIRDDAPEQGSVAEVQESDDQDDDDDDIPMAEDAPVPSAKKRGRPSLGASRISTPKTPKSANSVGRKRKVENSAEEPAAKRSGRGRATAAAASNAIKQVSAKRPRAAPDTSKAVRAHIPQGMVHRYEVHETNAPVCNRPPRPLAQSVVPSQARPSKRSTRLRRLSTRQVPATEPSTSSSGKAMRRAITPGSRNPTWRTPQIC